MKDTKETKDGDTVSTPAKARSGFLPPGPKAARASWMIPIFAMLGSCVWSNATRDQTEGLESFYRASAIAVALVMMAALVCGLILSIHALRSTRTFGRKGIMGSAIVGMVLNSVLLFAMIYGAILPYTGRLDGRWKQVHAVAGEGYTPAYKVDMKGMARNESDKGTHPNGITIYLFSKQAVSSRGHVMMRVLEVSAFKTGGIITNHESLYEDVIETTLSQFNGTEISREQVDEGRKRLIVEATAGRPSGRIRLEIHQRGSSVYGVIYFAEDGFWSQADAERFFSSFELLEKN